MAQVRLLSIKNNKNMISCQGKNLKEMLDELENTFPGIQNDLLSDGDLSRVYSFIVSNKGESRILADLNEQVTDDDLITILPLITGG